MPELFADHVTLTEQIAEAEREIKLRERVYPRMIRSRQMSEAMAERRLTLMRAIAETLRQVHPLK